MSEISSYMYFRSRKEITEHNIIKWAAQEIGPKCQYKRQHDTPSLWSWGRTSRTAGSTRLQHTTTDAKCWQSYVPSYYSENTEENKTKQTGKNTTFAEAWFHRPSLQINLPGTLPTAPSTPTGWSVQETSPLGGWAGLGARGCTSQLERRLALHSARLLPTAAPSRQTSSSNALLSAASLHLHCSPLWPFVPGKQLKDPANQRGSCGSA